MNSEATIAFRVDASTEIGTGHVMRCLALAKAWQSDGYKTVFICRALRGNLISFLEQRKFTVVTLPERKNAENFNDKTLPKHYPWLEADWSDDAQQTKEILKSISAELLVVDSYALDYRWQEAVLINDLKIFVFDDLADRAHLANWLLDQNAGRKIIDYQKLVPEDCQLFCGAEFALLRPEFAALRPWVLARRNELTTYKNILITMGGVDRDNTTLKILNFLKKLEEFSGLNIKVVIGPGYLYQDELRAQVSEIGKNIQILQNVTNMQSLMADADIAIGAAGSTAWERCCLGLPTLMTVLADNQIVVANELQKSGAAELFVWQDEHSFKSAWIRILNNYHGYSQAAAKLCRGDGLFKISAAIFSLTSLAGNVLSLRDVIEDDAMLLFNWQSAPETRRYARNKEIPIWEDHCAWLKKVLTNPLRRLMIMEEQGQPVACLRLDWLEKNQAEVSIYLNPLEYGRGLGFESLNLLRKLYPTLDFVACVLPENIASQRLFLKAGYVMFKENYYLNQGKKIEHGCH